MITRVYRGWNIGGLVGYLFGPGTSDDHVNPRVVASWDQRAERWQPAKTGPGEFDFAVEELVQALAVPVRAAGLPTQNPHPAVPSHRRFFRTAPDGTPVLRDGPVFHLTLRNHDADPTLSDQQWQAIAEELLHRAGVARRGDVGGPRWVAVRHDDDGIHIMATLVRQDRPQRVYPRYYKRRLREAADAMERRYGLVITAPSDGTAAAAESRGETEKAARTGRPVARVELREISQQAAAVTWNVGEFAAVLRQAGYRVEVSWLPSGQPRGWKIARTGETNRDGNPIWYSGSTLARDLGMPQLMRRWQQAADGRPATGELVGEALARRAVTVVTRARIRLRHAPEDADGLAHAVGEVRAALDHAAGPGTGAAPQWDRAARAPRNPVPAAGALARELRWLARGIGTSPGATGGQATLELTAALAALALQIAALLADRSRDHQAQAARRAATPQPPRPATVQVPAAAPNTRPRITTAAPVPAGAVSTPPSPQQDRGTESLGDSAGRS